MPNLRVSHALYRLEQTEHAVFRAADGDITRKGSSE